MEAKFNHFDHNGNAVMVDVSDKAVTERTAVASGKIRVNDAVMQAILQGTAKTGDGESGRDHGHQTDLQSDPHVPSAVPE